MLNTLSDLKRDYLNMIYPRIVSKQHSTRQDKYRECQRRHRREQLEVNNIQAVRYYIHRGLMKVK